MDDRISVVSYLAIGNDVVGARAIEIVDLAYRHELVNLDGARRLHRDVFDLVLGHFKLLIGVDLVALDDVVGRDFFAGVGIECGSADLDTRRRSGDIFGLQLLGGATLFETRATGQNSSGHLLTGRLALGCFDRP